MKLPHKYNEREILYEISRHIDKTYEGHYVGANNVQSLDLIFSTGNGLGFTVGNGLKYLARFGKKKGYNREDLLKAAHYVVLALHAMDINIQTDSPKPGARSGRKRNQRKDSSRDAETA